MTLKQFLKEVGGKEEDIVSYSDIEALRVVKQNGYILQYVKEQTEEICLEAVREDGDAFQYVKYQTEEICLKDVRQYGYALQYVKEQTPEIVYNALEQNPNLDINLIKITKKNGYCLNN